MGCAEEVECYVGGGVGCVEGAELGSGMVSFRVDLWWGGLGGLETYLICDHEGGDGAGLVGGGDEVEICIDNDFAYFLYFSPV